MNAPAVGFRLVEGRRQWVDTLTLAEEAGLVARLKSGDIEARGELVLHYAPLFMQMSRKYPYAGIEPDDLVQTINEKFLRADNDLYGKYEPQPGKRIFNWVAVVASNVVKSELRKHNTEQGLFKSADEAAASGNDGPTVLDMQRTSERSPLEQIMAARFTEMASRQIDALPNMQRRVIEAFICGQDTKSTARLLDISEGSVKTHAHRARMALSGLREALSYD